MRPILNGGGKHRPQQRILPRIGIETRHKGGDIGGAAARDEGLIGHDLLGLAFRGARRKGAARFCHARKAGPARFVGSHGRLVACGLSTVEIELHQGRIALKQAGQCGK
jgi:hypothetical protein